MNIHHCSSGEAMNLFVVPHPAITFLLDTDVILCTVPSHHSSVQTYNNFFVRRANSYVYLSTPSILYCLYSNYNVLLEKSQTDTRAQSAKHDAPPPPPALLGLSFRPGSATQKNHR